MPLDPYAPCPGGTGKKIKFCCPDLTGELDKIERMISAEQRAACSDHIESLLKKYPDRACLLAYKTELDLALGRREQAQAALSKYLEIYPDNPIALAEEAVLQASNQQAQTAATTLQRAIAAIGSQPPPAQVYDALGVVGQALLAAGHVMAARMHLMLQVTLTQAQDPLPLELLSGINGSPVVPLLLKQDFNLVDAPADALWKKSFDEAIALAHGGAWLTAAERLAELAERAGKWPAIMRNLAALRLWVGDDAGAIEPLRSFVGSADAPLDDAVEAEALAQLLDRESVDQLDLVTLRFAVRDTEQLQAQLFANAQTPRLPIDLTQLGTEDQPPPRAAFFLLDRPVPETAAGLGRDQVSQVVGEALLYGKQTDREARLEVLTYRGQELDAALRVVASVAGESVAGTPEEEVTGHVRAIDHLLTLSWRLPADTTPQQRAALMREERAARLLERWPQMPQKVFGGKSPAEAAGDPQVRLRVLGAILLIETTIGNSLADDFDYNALRRQLGLPEAGPVDPKLFPREEVPLVRLARVDLAKLNDEALADELERARHFADQRALRWLAPEVVRRPELKDADVKAYAYGVLAQSEPDLARARGYVEEARKTAQAAGRSTAAWDLAELRLLIGRGEHTSDAMALMQHIHRDHLREPGVAQALYQLLYEAGIIDEAGMPVAAAAAPGAAPAGAGLVVPGAAAAAPTAGGKIWTPGSEPAAGGGKKSAIWTPE